MIRADADHDNGIKSGSAYVFLSAPAVKHELAVDFGANGLWYYDGTTWSRKTIWDAENLTDVDLY